MIVRVYQIKCNMFLIIIRISRTYLFFLAHLVRISKSKMCM